MKKIQKKKGVTLVALVITIIIMLLLAGVVMQMALGDNGLIAKVSQSKIEQARAELYETAKIEYLSLKTKAIEKDEEEPPVNDVLSASGFLAKYDVNEDDITDKKGEVIDTKDNLLAKLSGMAGSGSGGHTTPETPTPQPYPEQSYPKTIDGVTIYEHDKDKMILKISIKERIKLDIREYSYNPDPKNIEVEWGNWGYDVFIPDSEYSGTTTGEHEYYPGEYIMKIKGAKSFKLINREYKYDKFEVTVLHWGKFEEQNSYSESNIIELNSVKDIKMPEPNDVTVNYRKFLMTTIPEDLFKYKPTRKNIGTFQECENLTTIPEDLYKYNTEMETIGSTFYLCPNLKTVPENLFKYNRKITYIWAIFQYTGITSIPENLFRYNTEVKTIGAIFTNSKITEIPENLFKYNTKLETIAAICNGNIGITRIPENLFKYNTEVKYFRQVFSYLTKLESISENIFKHNRKVENFESAFENNENLKEIPENLFANNIEAKNFMHCFMQNYKLKTIPENLFKNNVKAENFQGLFQNCRGIESIPENLFKYNTKVENFTSTFYNLEKVQTIPGNLFDNNLEAKRFDSTFAGTKITSIPWNLFNNNNNAESFNGTFSDCTSLTYLDLPSRLYSLQESQYRGIFRGCTNAHNYSSIPESWKSW